MGSNEPVFQDVMSDDVAADSDVVCERLFDMANAPAVRYRCGNAVVRIQQNNQIEDCTGGIVWETAFVLASFLERALCSSAERKSCDTASVLEVGAGCGLLGLVLWQAGHDVVLTEVDEAMPILALNTTNAYAATGRSLDRGPPVAQRLRWGDEDDMSAVLKQRRGYDFIVGTDVVFASRLVQPLLSTMHRMSHAGTIVYMCMQIRCEDAHAEFLQCAPLYFKRVEDISKRELWSDPPPACAFAEALDVLLFRLADPVPLGHVPSVTPVGKAAREEKKKKKRKHQCDDKEDLSLNMEKYDKTAHKKRKKKSARHESSSIDGHGRRENEVKKKKKKKDKQE